NSDSREINRLEVVSARLTGIDAKMIERLPMEIAETTFVFLAAVRAEDAAERPLGEAGRTDEAPAAAVGVACALQDRQLRGSTTERAGEFALGQIAIDRTDADFREPLCVGLQSDFREELLARQGVPPDEQH